MGDDPERPVWVIRPVDLPPETAPPGHRSPRRRDPLAVLALVLGIASIPLAGIVVGPVAMLCGLLVLTKRAGADPRSSSFALAGIGSGAVGFAAWTVIVWWMLSRGAPVEPQQVHPPSASAEADHEAVERAPAPLRRALHATVSLTVEALEGDDWLLASSGSGTMIAADAGRIYVVTCGHVVARVRTGGVRLRASWIGSKVFEGRVEWRDDDLDLAVVSVERVAEASLPELVPLGFSRTLHVGQRVFAVGDPIRYRTSMVSGVVSAIRKLGSGDSAARVIQSQIPLNPGNSGGGLYAEDGRLIGINSWTLPKAEAEGMGFSIAVDALQDKASDLPGPVSLAVRETPAEQP